jgi:hypothetical protein
MARTEYTNERVPIVRLKRYITHIIQTSVKGLGFYLMEIKSYDLTYI